MAAPKDSAPPQLDGPGGHGGQGTTTVAGSGGQGGGAGSGDGGGMGGVGGLAGSGGLRTGGTTMSSGGIAGHGGASSTPVQGGASATGGAPVMGGSPGSGGAGAGGAPGSGGTSVKACPTSASYVGNATWPDKLVVTSGAKYCGAFKEMRNLDQEYAAKATVVIAPGTYPLPNTAGSNAFALPVCFERRPGVEAPAFAGAGTLKTIRSTSSTTTFASCDQVAKQPIALTGSSSWSFSAAVVYWSWSGAPQPPALDGSVLDHPASGDPQDKSPGYVSDLELCDGTACDDEWQDVKFEACNPDYPLQRHTVVFQGGEIVLDVRITGAVGVDVMLAAFTSASGTLDGRTFSQTDYWKLVYSADHHHFTRNFAVLFDTPIGDACGLKVLTFYGTRDATTPLPSVYTIRCDLSNLAARTVSSATVAR